MPTIALIAGLLVFPSVLSQAPHGNGCPPPTKEIQRCGWSQSLIPPERDPYSSTGTRWLCMHIWPDGMERFVLCFWEPEP